MLRGMNGVSVFTSWRKPRSSVVEGVSAGTLTDDVEVRTLVEGPVVELSGAHQANFDCDEPPDLLCYVDFETAPK